MTTPIPNPLSSDAKRKLIMLRTLLWFTCRDEFPTATELATASDSRDRVPRGTISSRRAMIRDMRDAGLILVRDTDAQGFEHLAITENGTQLIERIDAEDRR